MWCKYRDYISKAKVDGCTALHLADKDFVKLLLDKGANVDSLSSTGSGVTPLHEAAYYGRVGIAELLIEGGATVDALKIGITLPP